MLVRWGTGLPVDGAAGSGTIVRGLVSDRRVITHPPSERWPRRRRGSTSVAMRKRVGAWLRHARHPEGAPGKGGGSSGGVYPHAPAAEAASLKGAVGHSWSAMRSVVKSPKSLRWSVIKDKGWKAFSGNEHWVAEVLLLLPGLVYRQPKLLLGFGNNLEDQRATLLLQFRPLGLP